VHVTRNANDNRRYRAKATTATIALVAGGYLVMSGTTAEPATAQSSDARKGGWLTQVVPTSTADPAQEQAGPQYVGATPKPKSADKSADPAASKDVLFRPGPQYDKDYDAKSQVDIYGAKSAVEPPRALELGRQQYTSGAYDESSTLLGQLNPLLPGLAIYGDWRTAVAYNSNNGKDIGQIATRLNRRRRLEDHRHRTFPRLLHAAAEKQQGSPASSSAAVTAMGKFNGEFDLRPQTLFFEGDLGSLYSGFPVRRPDSTFPSRSVSSRFSCRTGIWANDAILGGAVSLTAKNSRKLGLANYDVTFFAGVDNVDNVRHPRSGQAQRQCLWRNHLH
jgi:hypothetical protein